MWDRDGKPLAEFLEFIQLGFIQPVCKWKLAVALGIFHWGRFRFATARKPLTPIPDVVIHRWVAARAIPFEMTFTRKKPRSHLGFLGHD